MIDHETARIHFLQVPSLNHQKVEIFSVWPTNQQELNNRWPISGGVKPLLNNSIPPDDPFTTAFPFPNTGPATIGMVSALLFAVGSSWERLDTGSTVASTASRRLLPSGRGELRSIWTSSVTIKHLNDYRDETECVPYLPLDLHHPSLLGLTWRLGRNRLTCPYQDSSFRALWSGIRGYLPQHLEQSKVSNPYFQKGTS